MVFLWNNVGINGINTVKILLIGLDEGMFSLFAQGAAVRQTPERHWSPDTGFSQGAHNCSLTDSKPATGRQIVLFFKALGFFSMYLKRTDFRSLKMLLLLERIENGDWVEPLLNGSHISSKDLWGLSLKHVEAVV